MKKHSIFLNIDLIITGGNVMKWESFDTFNDIIKDYMPEYGEGETLASQTVTAVNKMKCD